MYYICDNDTGEVIMKKKEDLRIVKTKKNLFEGLIKLMKEKNFENIKVSEICSVALVNRSTFYDHFADKYELLEAMIADLQHEFIEELSQFDNIDSDREFYFKLISLLYDHIYSNINVYSQVLKNNFSNIAKDILKEKAIMDVYKRFSKSTENDSYAEFFAKFYVSGIIEVITSLIQQPDKMSKEEFFKYLKEAIPERIFKSLS